jgi:hypothetical protein
MLWEEMGSRRTANCFGTVAELGAHHGLFQLFLDIRKAIYTSNSVESLNWSLRKIIKTRGGICQ